MKAKNVMIALMMGLAVNAFANGNEKSSKHVDTYAVNTTESTVGWYGEKITGKNHNGTVTVKSGSILMNHGVLEGGEFTIDMNSIVSKDLEGEWADKLVGHLKSNDFFGVEKFPTSSFKITKVEKATDDAVGQKFNVTGDLTVRDKTHSITFPATIIQSGNNLSVVASFEFDRSKYDVKYGSGAFFDGLGDNLIKDNIKIDLKLRASAK